MPDQSPPPMAEQIEWLIRENGRMRDDLEVERAALILRLKEREHYAAWAIELADTAESFVYGQCSEGGLLETIARFRSAQIGERP